MKTFRFIMLSNVVFAQVLLCQTISAQVTFTSSNLPIVVVDTHGQTIVNEPKITADMGIIDNGEGVRNYITDPQNDFKGKVGIEIRGSTSQMFFPKKQYAVETRNDLGADTSVSLLGLPEESDWTLYAPYSDKTFFRNVLTYWLSAKLGRYASRFKFCELVINGEYMGVYVLFEKIKRGKNRVGISKLTSLDVTGDDLTGGYILKVDKTDGAGNGGWESPYPPFFAAWQKILWQYHYPKPEDITQEQSAYIQNIIGGFESLMNSSNFDDQQNGYPAIIDVPSFVDNFLINEMSKNVDAYRLSTFFYKDKDSKNPKLFAGPVWDYNIAWGNSNYYSSSVTSGWHLAFLSSDLTFMTTDQFQPPFWWKKLYVEPHFRIQYANRWYALRKNELSFSNIYHFIDSLKTLVNEAQVRNYQRWPILGQWIWPNDYVGQTYNDEVTHLKNWILERFIWMDGELQKYVQVDDPQNESPTTFQLGQNYPNPFNPETKIGFQVPENCFVDLHVFDVLGEEVAHPISEFKTAGKYEIAVRLTGTGSGLYFYKLKAGSFSEIRKMILLK